MADNQISTRHPNKTDLAEMANLLTKIFTFDGLVLVQSHEELEEEFDDESLPDLCHKKVNPSEYTHLMDIPVLSLATNRTYANVFCARCHSDASRLARWNVSIECNEDINE